MEKKSFEQSLTKLEEIVKVLEHGDISLEEAMGLFEEGVGLTAECTKLLDQAEQKVVKLVGGKEEPIEELKKD